MSGVKYDKFFLTDKQRYVNNYGCQDEVRCDVFNSKTITKGIDWRIITKNVIRIYIYPTI